ncbi:MAG: DJ-1/PfpI family protein [Actinomycetota bacterium]
MQVACVLYDEFTMLDIVGPFQFLQAAGHECLWVAPEAGPVLDHTRSMPMTAGQALAEVTDPDIVVLPGGLHTSSHFGGPIRDWLQDVHQRTSWTTSVCTGSLLLADAGLLDGLTATGHWAAMEQLGNLGAVTSEERVIMHKDERIVTAAGVSSGIDMALVLLAEIDGVPAAEAAQLALEYDPQPITDAGSPAKAGPELVALLQGFFAGSL